MIVIKSAAAAVSFDDGWVTLLSRVMQITSHFTRGKVLSTLDIPP